MKIWKEFKTLNEFSKTNASRMSCTRDCEGCKTLLTSIDTKFVHMIVNIKRKTRYICDECLNSNKNK